MENIVTYILNLKDNMSQVIATANVGAKELETNLGGVRNMALSVGSAFGVAFGIAGIVAFTKKTVEAGAVVENATTGLTTLLKDSGEAAQVVKNTMEDATKTPFSFEGLLAGNKALISAGVDAKKSREDVLNLANAIAATGGTDVELQRMVVNLQQISNTGKASAEDIKQFGFAGINIYKVLSESTGKSIEQIKKMPVTYDQLTIALKKAHEQGGIYYNGLENMSGNVSVKISNIGDSLFQFFNNIFVELKPIINDALNTTLNILSDVGNKIVTAIKWAKEHKTNLMEIGKIVLWVGGIYAAYKTTVMGVMAVEKLMVFWKGASATASTLLVAWDMARAEGLGVLTAAQWALNVAMDANPIGLVIAGIAALVGGVMWAWNTFEGFRKVVFVVWEVLKAFAIGVGKAFWGMGETILGALTLNPSLIKKGLVDTVSAVKDAVKEIGEAGEKGSAEGAKSWQGSKAQSLIPKKSGGKEANTSNTGAGVSEPKTKAEGQKTINIHVAYNAPLIKEFTISTTNIKEGLGNLKDKVSEILVGATHDSLMVADY